MTLWEADEMDTITSALHDGSDGLSESIYLFPQWLHTVKVVIKGKCGHIGTWMRLKHSGKQKLVSFSLDKKENYVPNLVNRKMELKQFLIKMLCNSNLKFDFFF